MTPETRKEFENTFHIDNGILEIWERVLPDGDWEGHTATLKDIEDWIDSHFIEKSAHEAESVKDAAYLKGLQEAKIIIDEQISKLSNQHQTLYFKGGYLCALSETKAAIENKIKEL